jgi:hypothetical protein
VGEGASEGAGAGAGEGMSGEASAGAGGEWVKEPVQSWRGSGVVYVRHQHYRIAGLCNDFSEQTW